MRREVGYMEPPVYLHLDVHPEVYGKIGDLYLEYGAKRMHTETFREELGKLGLPVRELVESIPIVIYVNRYSTKPTWIVHARRLPFYCNVTGVPRFPVDLPQEEVV